MLVPAAVLCTSYGVVVSGLWRNGDVICTYILMYSVQVRKAFRTGLSIMHSTDMSGWMLRPAVCVFDYLYVWMYVSRSNYS